MDSHKYLPTFHSLHISKFFKELEFIATKDKWDEDKKFLNLIKCLPESEAVEYEDLLAPDRDARYETLKARVEAHYGATKESRLNNLISIFELGDMKPSELLAQLKVALGAMCEVDGLLKTKFLGSLPDEYRPHLMSFESADVNELAKQADKLQPFVQKKRTVSVVGQGGRDTTRMEIQRELPSLETQIGCFN